MSWNIERRVRPEEEHRRRLVAVDILLLALFGRDRVFLDVAAGDLDRDRRLRSPDPCARSVVHPVWDTWCVRL